MSKRITIIGMLAVLSALGIGAWVLQSQQESIAAAVVTEPVTLGMAPSLNYLTLIALEQGYFADAGLAVEVKEYSTGKRVLKDGLLGQEVEVAIVGLGPLTFETLEREDLKIIGSITTWFDLYKIVARRDQGVSSAIDLQGKRVATSKASSFHYFLHNYLVENGVTEESVETLFGESAELAQALANGDADAISVREPFISEATDLLGDKAIILSEPNLPANILNLVALDGVIQERPQVAERILKALVQAEDFAGENPDQAIKIVANRLGLEESEVAERWSNVDMRVTLGQELILNMEDIARWAIRGELTDKTSVPNYLDYIYPDGLESVNPEAVTIIR